MPDQTVVSIMGQPPLKHRADTHSCSVGVREWLDIEQATKVSVPEENDRRPR